MSLSNLLLSISSGNTVLSIHISRGCSKPWQNGKHTTHGQKRLCSQIVAKAAAQSLKPITALYRWLQDCLSCLGSCSDLELQTSSIISLLVMVSFNVHLASLVDTADFLGPNPGEIIIIGHQDLGAQKMSTCFKASQNQDSAKI